MESALPSGQHVALTLRAAESGFVGQLEIHRADGSTYDREVSGATCEEVANALAFVLALALGAKDPSPEPARAVPEVVAQAAPPALPPLPPPAASLPAANPPSTLVATPRLADPVGRRRRSAWSLGVGVRLGLRAGLSPNAMLVESAFLETRRASSTPFELALRLGFANAQRDGQSSAQGTADFSWQAAYAEACFVRLRLLAPLELLPCAGMHAGQLEVTGHPAPGAGVGSHTAPTTWVDALASLRLELPVLRWLSLGLEGQVVVPFTPNSFTFDGPDSTVTVYQIPRLASAAFLGIAARFE